MIFSKSFGYALRGVLYVVTEESGQTKVQLEEIAAELGVPRHFLGKVMKKLVKEGVLNSLKGRHGGFFANQKTLDTSLLRLVRITGETEASGDCVLHFRKCNAEHPCPLHQRVESVRKEWQELLSSTSVGDLLKKETPDFIRSITTF